MPLYTFRCPECNTVKDFYRKVNGRNNIAKCQCGERMQRTPERFTAETFEPYYDEGLDCDFHNKSEWKSEMRRQGVIQVGDRVGGAINWDEKNPTKIEKQPPKGRRRNPCIPVDTQVVECVDR